MSQAAIAQRNTALSYSEGTEEGKKFVDEWGTAPNRKRAIKKLEAEMKSERIVLRRKWSVVDAELRDRQLKRMQDRIAASELDRSA